QPLGKRNSFKPIYRATHNREHITHSRVRLALSHNTDKRVVHFSSVCPLRSGMGPPSPAPLRLRGSLATAEPMPLSSTVPLASPPARHPERLWRRSSAWTRG